MLAAHSIQDACVVILFFFKTWNAEIIRRTSARIIHAHTSIHTYTDMPDHNKSRWSVTQFINTHVVEHLVDASAIVEWWSRFGVINQCAGTDKDAPRVFYWCFFFAHSEQFDRCASVILLYWWYTHLHYANIIIIVSGHCGSSQLPNKRCN